MVKNSQLKRVGPKWIEMEARVKRELPWMSSPELTDRVAYQMMQDGVVDRWLRVEKRRRRPRGLFGRLFG